MEFIRVDPESRTYSLQQHARELLCRTHAPITVVSCAGLYRTGKSSLLNCICTALSSASGRLDKSSFPVPSVFKSSNSTSAETMGMWAQLCTVGDRHFLIVDTEGLGNTDVSASHDNNILTMSFLLSSLLVYNSVGPITSSSISELKCAAKTSTLLRPPDSAGVRLGTLLWVLRDFSLTHTVSDEDYIQSTLDKSIGNGNKTSSYVKDAFRSHHCVTVPRPCVNTKVLEHVDAAFTEKINVIIEYIKQTSPQSIKGKVMTGPLFVAVVEQFIHSMNTSTRLPVFVDLWDSVMRLAAITAKERVIQKYKTFLTQRTFVPAFAAQTHKYMISLLATCTDMEGFDVLSVVNDLLLLEEEERDRSLGQFANMCSGTETVDWKAILQQVDSASRTVLNAVAEDLGDKTQLRMESLTAENHGLVIENHRLTEEKTGLEEDVKTGEAALVSYREKIDELTKLSFGSTALVHERDQAINRLRKALSSLETQSMGTVKQLREKLSVQSMELDRVGKEQSKLVGDLAEERGTTQCHTATIEELNTSLHKWKDDCLSVRSTFSNSEASWKLKEAVYDEKLSVLKKRAKRKQVDSPGTAELQAQVDWMRDRYEEDKRVKEELRQTVCQLQQSALYEKLQA